MKKLSENEMKQVLGGFAMSSCSLKCSDGIFHTHDCGTYSCETLSNGTITCSNSSGNVVSTHDPCAA